MAKVSSMLGALVILTLSACNGGVAPSVRANPGAGLFDDYREFRVNDVVTVRLDRYSGVEKVKAVVKKVLPNGDLLLAGPGLSGVARPQDIAQDNSVRSAYLREPRLAVAGR